jgi:hypothetical protein
LKSEQALDEGTRFDDVQVPRSADTPVADGPAVLVRS